MIGIPAQLLISWILLKFVEKKDLNVLGLKPTLERLKDFLLGFIIAGSFIAIFYLAASQLTANPYRINEAYTPNQFFKATGYVIISVLYEELIFRGAVLYILFTRLGARKAVLISAAAFGIYHWFSFGVFGQAAPMIFVFLTTGFVGYALAIAFLETKSLYLPNALHLGYNFVNMVIFSNDKAIGSQLLVRSYEVDPATNGVPVAIMMQGIYFLGFPFLILGYLRWRSIYAKKR